MKTEILRGGPAGPPMKTEILRGGPAELYVEFAARIREEGGLGPVAITGEQVSVSGTIDRPTPERLIDLLSARGNRRALRRIVASKVDAIVTAEPTETEFDDALACVVRALLSIQEDLRDSVRVADCRAQAIRDGTAFGVSRFSIIPIALMIAGLTRAAFPSTPLLPDDLVNQLRSSIPAFVELVSEELGDTRNETTLHELDGASQQEITAPEAQTDQSDPVPFQPSNHDDGQPENDPGLGEPLPAPEQVPEPAPGGTDPGQPPAAGNLQKVPLEAQDASSGQGNDLSTTSDDSKSKTERTKEAKTRVISLVFTAGFVVLLGMIVALENFLLTNSRVLTACARGADDAIASIGEILARISVIRGNGPRKTTPTPEAEAGQDTDGQV